MIDPRGMTLMDWADSVVLDRQDGWAFGRLDDETQWQTWATGFLRSATPAIQCPPDPYAFSDWKEWAMRAYLALEVV